MESSRESRIVVALASRSGGDETRGNDPSTADNDEIELFMKESIELSAPHWCFKPHAPKWGAGVCCFLCFTNRLFPSTEQTKPKAAEDLTVRRKNAANRPDTVTMDVVNSEHCKMVWHALPSSLCGHLDSCWAGEDTLGGSGELRPDIMLTLLT